MLTNESSIEEGYFFFIYLFISFFLFFLDRRTRQDFFGSRITREMKENIT